MTKTKKLKRVVIKEEIFALVGGHHIPALILNQFIYWSERNDDTDEYILEEIERCKKSKLPEPNIPLMYGWTHKKTDELIDELMVNVSRQTIRRYIKKLVNNGWLDERRNPKHGWDKTWQYRPNIIKIQMDLMKIGYHLEGYMIDEELQKLIIPLLNSSQSNVKNLTCSVKKLTCSVHDGPAIPEITNNITINNRHSDISVSGDTPISGNAPGRATPLAIARYVGDNDDIDDESNSVTSGAPMANAISAVPNGTHPGSDINNSIKSNNTLAIREEKEPEVLKSPTPPIAAAPPSPLKKKTTRKKSSGDPRTKHPAIQAYREANNQYPAKNQYDFVIKRLGDNPDIEILKHVCELWHAKSYNPKNVDGKTSWYQQALESGDGTNWQPYNQKSTVNLTANERNALKSLKEAIDKIGSYRPQPGFNDHKISAVVSQMGWQRLCRMPPDQLDSRFLASYRKCPDKLTDLSNEIGKIAEKLGVST